MLIVDVASGDILEEIPAHSKELWSVTLFPDLVIFSDTNVPLTIVRLKLIDTLASRKELLAVVVTIP